MQRIGDEYTVQDAQGRASAYATITVYNADSSGNKNGLASIYAAAGQAVPTTPIANPTTTDAYGRWRVALADGRYIIEVSGTNFPMWSIPNITVFDNTITYPSPMLGTVTSVGISVPSDFTVGGPVTSSGTIAIGYGSWGANKCLIAPNGSSGTPTVRNLVLADLPSFGPAAATYGSGTLIPVLTVNAQGIITGVSTTAVTAGWSSLTGKPTSMGSTGLIDGVWMMYTTNALYTVNNTTSEISIFGGTGVGSRTILANTLRSGSVIRVKATAFTLGTAPTTGGAPLLKLKMGATTLLSVALGTLWPVMGQAASIGSCEFLILVTDIGATGHVIAEPLSPNNTGYYATASGMTAVVAMDTTANQAIDLTLTMGTAGVPQGWTLVSAQVIQEA